MTCCVAAIANGGNAIILVSDKMIGTANNEASRMGSPKAKQYTRIGGLCSRATYLWRATYSAV